MFTLAISCLTTSNLPWFMDLTFQVPMQCCSLQHRTLLLPPDTLTLWLSFFIPSGAISPLFSSSILGTYQPEEFVFQCHIFLSFHTIYRVFKARMLKCFAIPFSSGPHFVRTLQKDPSKASLLATQQCLLVAINQNSKTGVIPLKSAWCLKGD